MSQNNIRNPGTGPVRKQKQNQQLIVGVAPVDSRQSNRVAEASSKSAKDNGKPFKAVNAAKHVGKHFDSRGKTTAKYIKVISSPPTSHAALERINAWITSQAKNIDDTEFYSCKTCGNTELTICACHIGDTVKSVKCDTPDVFPTPMHPTISGSRTMHFLSPIKIFAGENIARFDARTINNDSIFDELNNSQISDEFIIEPMYNYIRLYQSYSYASRRERYIHSQKLAHKFLELKKIKPENLTPLQVNCIQVTIQRSTDQVENALLSAETSPTRARYFPRAWLGNWFVLLLFTLIVTPFHVCIWAVRTAKYLLLQPSVWLLVVLLVCWNQQALLWSLIE